MKSYKVCIIGLGRISYKHLETFKKLENFFKVTAISDLKISNFNKAKKKFSFINNCKFYFNYIDMIKTEKPDISIILTESGNHAKNYFEHHTPNIQGDQIPNWKDTDIIKDQESKIISSLKQELQELMSEGAGIFKSNKSLLTAEQQLEKVYLNKKSHLWLFIISY